MVGALLGYNYEKSEAPERLPPILAESRFPVAVSGGSQAAVWEPPYGGIVAKSDISRV